MSSGEAIHKNHSSGPKTFLPIVNLVSDPFFSTIKMIKFVQLSRGIDKTDPPLQFLILKSQKPQV